MNRKLQAQSDVRHLNFPGVRRTLPAHEFRSLRSLAGARTHSLADAQALACALPNRGARETFWLAASVASLASLAEFASPAVTGRRVSFIIRRRMPWT